MKLKRSKRIGEFAKLIDYAGRLYRYGGEFCGPRTLFSYWIHTSRSRFFFIDVITCAVYSLPDNHPSENSSANLRRLYNLPSGIIFVEESVRRGKNVGLVFSGKAEDFFSFDTGKDGLYLLHASPSDIKALLGPENIS